MRDDAKLQEVTGYQLLPVFPVNRHTRARACNDYMGEPVTTGNR
jgi:hypothetical protein